MIPLDPTAQLSSVEEFWFSLHEIFSKNYSYCAWEICFCGLQFSVDFNSCFTVVLCLSLKLIYMICRNFPGFMSFLRLLSIWLQFLRKWFLSISLRSSKWRTQMHATLPIVNEALTEGFWVVPSLLIRFKVPNKFEEV